MNRMERDKFIVTFWYLFIPFAISLPIILIHSAHRESDRNIARAETLLSNTWNQPYEIDKDRLSRDSVIFYSDGYRYEIDTIKWNVERQ